MRIGGMYTIDFTRVSKIPKFSVTIKKGDSKRTIELILLQNSQAINLDDYTVTVAAKKSDGNDIFNDVKIIDAENGICEVEITEQMLATNLDLPCEIILYGADGTVASSSNFVIGIVQSVRNEESIVSSSEFTALSKALTEVKNIDNRFKEVGSQINTIATNVIIFGADSTGMNDSTKAFNNAILSLKNGSKMIIPNGIYRLDSAVILENLENIELEFYGELNATSTDTEKYVFNLINCKNITFKNYKVSSIRDKQETPPGNHTRITELGSNRIGINMSKCENIFIINPIFESMSYDIKIASSTKYPPQVGLNKNILIDNIISNNTSQPIYISNTDNLTININKITVANDLGGGDHFVYISSNTRNIYINNGELNADENFGVAFNCRTAETSMGELNVEDYDDSKDPKNIFINNVHVNSRSFLSAKATTKVKVNNSYFNGQSTSISSPRVIIQEEYSDIEIRNSNFVTPVNFLFTTKYTNTNVFNSNIECNGQLVQVTTQSIDSSVTFTSCKINVNDAIYYCTASGICNAIFKNCEINTTYTYVFSKRKVEGSLKVISCEIYSAANITNVIYNSTIPSENIKFINNICDGFTRIISTDDTGTIVSYNNIINDVIV